MSDRSKSRELMARIVPHTNVIWAHNPAKHSLGVLMKPLEEMHEYTNAVEGLNKIVQELRSNVSELSDYEIVGGVRSMYSVRDEIIGWYDLRDETNAELVKRHGIEEARHIGCGL